MEFQGNSLTSLHNKVGIFLNIRNVIQNIRKGSPFKGSFLQQIEFFELGVNHFKHGFEVVGVLDEVQLVAVDFHFW